MHDVLAGEAEHWRVSCWKLPAAGESVAEERLAGPEGLVLAQPLIMGLPVPGNVPGNAGTCRASQGVGLPSARGDRNLKCVRIRNVIWSLSTGP